MFLCLAVLVWGTSYKVSLYSMAGEFCNLQSNPINPPAKLLSEKERPTRPISLDHDKAIPKPAVTPLFLWIVVFLASVMQVRIRLQRSRARAWLARHLCGNEDSLLSHFGFRPPPSL